MKKYFILLILAFICQLSSAQPLPVKQKHSIIIDTDGAIDDMRAISMMLSRPEITIKAVLLSDGSLTPLQSGEKVSSLLKEFGFDKIPVAAGINNKRGESSLASV